MCFSSTFFKTAERAYIQFGQKQLTIISILSLNIYLVKPKPWFALNRNYSARREVFCKTVTMGVGNQTHLYIHIFFHQFKYKQSYHYQLKLYLSELEFSDCINPTQTLWKWTEKITTLQKIITNYSYYCLESVIKMKAHEVTKFYFYFL